MDMQLIGSNAALPTVLRGIRTLRGISSIRELGRTSGASPAVISRLERGLAMPTPDLLWRWASGLNDGRTDPELWTTTIYAAAATWPGEAQFLLVRYADPQHDPELCWALACGASDLVRTTLKEDVASDRGAAYIAAGAHRYARFASLVEKGDMDAHRTAWFALVRQAVPTVVAELSRYLLDPDDPVSEPDERVRRALAAHLMEIYVENGQGPIRVSASPDEVLSDLLAHWPRLSRAQRDIIRRLIVSWLPE